MNLLLTRTLRFVLFILLCAPVAAQAKPNVILLTLDGVRWQEFFDKTTFEKFWTRVAKQGTVYGTPGSDSYAAIDNRMMMSLPAYQNIMAGSKTRCISNRCARIPEETVAERLIDELSLEREQVATFSSWQQIPFAVESVPGKTMVNSSVMPFTLWPDPVHERLNHLQQSDRPRWRTARWDKYTWPHAMRYLDEVKPRFMFISLGDADEWGHRRSYDRYISALKQYDIWIDELVAKLDSMGEYGSETLLIVTTDHGRGEGRRWKGHALHPKAKTIWMYVRNPKVGPVAPRGGRVSHSDIRPTIEAHFGMTPDCAGSSIGCGKPLTETLAR